MTSLLSNTRQMSNEIGYFIPLASLIGKIYLHTDPSPAGLNTGLNGGTFSTAMWANSIAPGNGPALSSINAAGAGLLEDMGRTIVSSLRTFRKIQVVRTGVNGSNSTLSTFGVGGAADGIGQDYYTGYIELGFEGNGVPAPVAHFGR